ncbi:hypothetical protein JSY14_10440 [Brachybacterium sp. EF45031]|uniref:hypothetical protein n=1 Tax=Brachybacterium sillae TaxID=2810536 RepID=UPI00217DC6C7|nr:hypothetical protein [Brachybacterium sillae]MCS6712424.1 hypothetical protein [Brachybacterium sillae]
MSRRLGQVLLAVVVGVVSAALMIVVHRAGVELGGVRWPVGLVLGAAFQLAASLFLLAATGSRLPVLMMLLTWVAAAMALLGEGAGGGVLVPAQLAGRPQYAGWVVQVLGVVIPAAVIAAASIRRLSRLQAGRAGTER